MNDKPMWPVGFFGQNSNAPNQNLNKLALGGEEFELLSKLQSVYKNYLLSKSKEDLQKLRDLNHKLRDIVVCDRYDDAYCQQLEWQTLLY